MEDGEQKKSPRQKALELNLDPLIYGSIAEIGAGQEVARHFFQAGGASGTVAKTVSAYDMKVSDAMYGADASGRYVTRTRLDSMLDTELDLVIQRVASVRPQESTFFAFADTVTAKAYQTDKECHGWMGIEFQHAPCAEPSKLVLHLRMHDSSNRGQQEALGTLGVNLIHSAFFFREDPETLIDSLMDNLEWGRVEVDFLDFDGPCFEGVDNRAMNLRLVTSSLGPVVMFGPDGQAAVPADLIHGKDMLILRGTFRPFEPVHEDMLRLGLASHDTGQDVAPFCEMNIARYLSEGLDEAGDLLERTEAITRAGYNAMITSHLRYFRLGEYFSHHEKRRIGFAMSVDNITTIFDESYYDGLEGGILEAMGKLFASDAVLLVYPNLTRDGEIVTVDTVEVPGNLQHLYQHLVQNRRIIPLEPDRDTLVPFG